PLHHSPRIELSPQGEATGSAGTYQTCAQHVPVHRLAFLAIAEMSRDVMEHGRELERLRPHRQRPFEDVVTLVRVEMPELVAHDHLVVGEERGAADAIVEDVEFAAEIRVPGEALVVAAEVLGVEMEGVAGKKRLGARA